MMERKVKHRVISWLLILCLIVLEVRIPIKAEAAAAVTDEKIYYVSQQDGNDGNSGTEDSPFKTINHAAQIAEPGDTVIVKKGVYRECVRPAKGGTDEENRITYMAEEPGQAVIKGSEQIVDWEQDGAIWKVVLDSEEVFGDYNPYTKGHGKDTFDYFPVYNCGDVYLNEEAYYQKATVDEVRKNSRTWYSEVDETEGTTTIYANFGAADPNEELAEINVRQQCFAPTEWGLAYITVNGFKVAHAANMYSDFPGYPEHCQSGAISTNGGLKWIIENNTVVNARSIGIDIGLRCDMWAGNRDPRKGNQEDQKYFTSYKDIDAYGQHIVRNNLIQKCGQCGIAGVFSWKSQIMDNVIEDTNYRNEFCAAETAGIKVHYCNDGLIQGNYVRNTIGGGSAGIWTDWGNQGIRVTQNVLVNNVWGYYAEAVVGPILVDNNIFIENERFRSLDGAGVTFANNLFYNTSMSYDGSGRNCMVFEPHTMNDREVYSKPQYFKWYNNISIGKAIVNPKGEYSVMEGNCSNAGNNFTYSASTDSVKISFNLTEEPTGSQVMVNPALIGIIEPAGEGIRDIVNKDYFGKAYDEQAMPAGPFADIAQGQNSYTVWPRKNMSAPPSTAVEEENLAIGKTVKASSEVDGNTAEKAVDGNSGTRYESAQTDSEWFEVDLGKETKIQQIKILWEAAYAKAYTIQVSNDEETWQDVYTTESGDGGTDLLDIAAAGRYVRMNCTKRATTYGFSFYEFQVYGDSSENVAEAPVFEKTEILKTVNEGEMLSFTLSASDANGKDIVYRALGSLPAGAELDANTGAFSWTPDSTQSGKYVLSFLADNGEASAAYSVIVEVVDTILADTEAPVWTEESSLSCALSQNGMLLSWDAAEDVSGVSHYLIYRDGLLCKEVKGDVTETEVGNLENGKSYTFVVKAKDVWGNTTKNEDSLSSSADTPKELNGMITGISRNYPKEYKDWQEAFVAGDGKIGMMVFGNPLEETVILNDRKFFVAATTDKPERTINTVSQEDLDQIKEYLVNEQWKEANDLANQVHGWQDGGEGNKHPGYEMLINVLGESGEVQDYKRTQDYSTGEITVRWTDDRGAWERKAFVSRKDNVAVEYLTNPTEAESFGCEVKLTTDPGMHLPAGMTITDASTVDFLNLRAVYPKTDNAGYEGVTKVITDGTKTLEDGVMSIENATYVLLLTKNEKYYTDCQNGWDAQKLQEALNSVPQSYEELMAGQIETHQEIYDRVSIDLNAPAEDRLLTNEELLQKQKESTEPVLALYERIFAAGRYHYLSSSSNVAPPDLLGLWTGDTNVGWSGYYHLDANLNLQISSGNVGNMPEAMEGYFYLMDQWKEDFATNARKLLGCRGYLSGGNSPGETSGIISSLNYQYPYQYVTGGEAWLIYPFWEYYEITRDQDFLRDRIYPYLKEMGYFYQDFLTEKDENGNYIFAGSISPESQPAGIGLSLVNNSTFDIAGADFVLSTLLETCEILGVEESDETPISEWKEIYENLPPYLINNDGALAEWSWPSLKDRNQYGHRHSSHLVGVWPYRTITAEEQPELYKAAQKALQQKDKYAYEGAGHGLLHSALIATNLNDGESVGKKILRLLKEDFYYGSLTTSHYANHGTYCTDVANSMPGIMMEMCMSSTEDTLELLPAVPSALNSGSISGLKAKCQVTLNDMSWDLSKNTVDCTITSDVDQKINLIQRSGIKKIETTAKTEESDFGATAKVITLKAGEATTIHLDLINEEVDKNLALNKPAYASSELMNPNEKRPANEAVDGNLSTRWGTVENDVNAWFYVDLEDTYDINRVVIEWETAYAEAYKIQVSEDGKNWTDVYDVKDNESKSNEISLKATGRYVRMQGVKPATRWGYSIWEFEVYGKVAVQENLALNKPASAMNFSNPTVTPDKAFDGDRATRWGGHQDDDNWLSVDLEDNYIIHTVVLDWEDAYAKEYKIQVSNDGENWSDVYETHNSPGGRETITLETPAKARYVKMQGILRAGEWGYSLYEMEVYGRPDEGEEPEVFFEDVDSSDWFYEEVSYLCENKIIQGIGDGSCFAPYDELSRNQLAVMLWRMEGSPEVPYSDLFPDVPADTWYTDAVLWGNSNNIITGYDDGRFGVADMATREQIITMLYRYAQSKGYDVEASADLSTFKDVSDVHEFAKEAMQWAVGTGIISGKFDGTMLDPQNAATRAESAAIFTRFMKYYGSTADGNTK